MQKTLSFATRFRTARMALAVSALTLLAAVSATAQTTLAGWGANDRGQLNLPTDANRFVAVAAGADFALGLRDDGTVEGWGNNDLGQCSPPAGLSGVVQISAANGHSVALKSDGTVVCWGSNFMGESNVPAGLSNVVSVSAGGFSTVALLADDTVVDWGNGYVPERAIPDGVTGIGIAAGYFQDLILKADGTVTSYGAFDSSWIPRLSGIKGLACGKYHGAAIRTDGTVTAWWISQYFGQDRVPSGLSDVVALSAGDYFTLALKSNGTVVSWGSNFSGEGNIPSGLKDVVSIAAGSQFGLALSVPALDLTSPTSTFYSGSTATVRATAKFMEKKSVPRTVTFTSSDPAAVAAPAPVTIPAGATEATFILNHAPVSALKTVIITAQWDDLSHPMPLTLQPIYVKKVSFDHNNAEGGINFTGSVTLNAPTKKPLVVSLSGDSPSYLNVAGSTTVAASNTTALFSLSTSPVPTNTTVHVTAQAGGAPFVAPLNIVALAKVKTFTLAKTSVYGGQKTIGTVTLDKPSGDGGTQVVIYINGPDCSGPGSIFIPKGQTQGTAEIVGADVSLQSVTPISARTNFSEIVKPLTVKPLAVKAIALSPSTIRSGETSTVTVTLVDVAPTDTIVELTLSKPDAASLPATLTIPAGTKSATFTLTRGSVTIVKTIQVRASRLGASRSAVLTITP